jgi:hypothetical protein
MLALFHPLLLPALPHADIAADVAMLMTWRMATTAIPIKQACAKWARSSASDLGAIRRLTAFQPISGDLAVGNFLSPPSAPASSHGRRHRPAERAARHGACAHVSARHYSATSIHWTRRRAASRRIDDLLGIDPSFARPFKAALSARSGVQSLTPTGSTGTSPTGRWSGPRRAAQLDCDGVPERSAQRRHHPLHRDRHRS